MESKIIQSIRAVNFYCVRQPWGIIRLPKESAGPIQPEHWQKPPEVIKEDRWQLHAKRATCFFFARILQNLEIETSVLSWNF